ncbi:thioredoxin-like protein [Linderina pennispora]|uniref:Thioredoxin-like protein n=1 Tax=Linderina pennispora TaxID=61395 RepID=A0A1Y1WCI0_9FUNG|nr:thioredoxin-like protein [Linderina pennispora]ORX71142.1 thioredoxin-like protein [Linderina pennispora]
MAVNVERAEQFVQLINESMSKLVVVDFYSQTCAPCRIVDGVLEELSQTYGSVGFYKVDVQRFGEVAAQCQITATPTLQLFRRGRKVGEVRGASKPAIISAIDAALQDSAPAASAYGVHGHADITSTVIATQSECLNQNDDFPLANVFKADDSVLESDVDEQMVLHVVFNQPVKLHSLMLKCADDVGFDDAEQGSETQAVEMTEETYQKGGVVGLRFVRFQNVHSLSVFIEDNLGGGDVTALQQLAFIGTAVNTANMSDIRQGEEH